MGYPGRIIYCRECGSRLVEKWNGTYNPETGKKEMGLRCPSMWCEWGSGIMVASAFSAAIITLILLTIYDKI